MAFAAPPPPPPPLGSAAGLSLLLKWQDGGEGGRGGWRYSLVYLADVVCAIFNCSDDMRQPSNTRTIRIIHTQQTQLSFSNPSLPARRDGQKHTVSEDRHEGTGKKSGFGSWPHASCAYFDEEWEGTTAPVPASSEALLTASLVPGTILLPLRRKWARAPSREASIGYHPSVT